MSSTTDPAEERRARQAEMFGMPMDRLATLITEQTKVTAREVAQIIGVSWPMFNEVVAGRRTKFGNPVATHRLTMLRDFAQALAEGTASSDDITLRLAQIHASTLTPPPDLTAQVAQESAEPAGLGAAPAAAPDPSLAPTSVGTPADSPADSPADHPADSPAPSAAAAAAPSAAAAAAPSAAAAAKADDKLSGLSKPDLERARAEVAKHVRPTPTRRWPLIDRATGAHTWIKHENHNPTAAFKVRGGLNYMARLKATEPDVSGVISATRGNHGQSLAYAGREYDVPVTIVVPEDNSPDKNAQMEALGAELIVHGEDFQAAAERAAWLAHERDLEMVPSFHPWLVEGVATYAAELHESVPDLDAIYVPIGMGSGAAANILVRDLLGLDTEIVGVVADGAPAYSLSFQAKAPISTSHVHTFVDGVACRKPDRDAVRVLSGGAARVLTVTDAETAAAMALCYRATHNLPEPAGAIALAGLISERDEMAGKNVAVIFTGGNCDFPILKAVMKEHG